jgi:hypothetical protein
MPQPTIAVIPLDDRSVNYECLQLLGEAAGLRVRAAAQSVAGHAVARRQT